MRNHTFNCVLRICSVMFLNNETTRMSNTLQWVKMHAVRLLVAISCAIISSLLAPLLSKLIRIHFNLTLRLQLSMGSDWDIVSTLFCSEKNIFDKPWHHPESKWHYSFFRRPHFGPFHKSAQPWTFNNLKPTSSPVALNTTLTFFPATRSFREAPLSTSLATTRRLQQLVKHRLRLGPRSARRNRWTPGCCRQLFAPRWRAARDQHSVMWQNRLTKNHSLFYCRIPTRTMTKRIWRKLSRLSFWGGKMSSAKTSHNARSASLALQFSRLSAFFMTSMARTTSFSEDVSNLHCIIWSSVCVMWRDFALAHAKSLCNTTISTQTRNLQLNLTLNWRFWTPNLQPSAGRTLFELLFSPCLKVRIIFYETQHSQKCNISQRFRV